MWVCICNAVRDREVHDAIVDGAVTREAVTMACGAGGDCGACHHMIEQMIEAHGGDEAEMISPAALVRHRAA